MDEVDVPPFFLCPISLEIMKDPVTVSTGITYDRDSIDKWLITSKNSTCPVTKQPLSSDSVDELTPNHTLRRLIQSWCTLNASRGIQRIPTPKPPVSTSDIARLLSDASKSPHSQTKCLRRLRSISGQSSSNKRCIEAAAGAVDFLASVIITDNNASGDATLGRTLTLTLSASASASSNGLLSLDVRRPMSDEALSILYNLQLSESSRKSLLIRNDGAFVDALIRVMQHGSYDSRAYAVMLLNSMFEVADPLCLISMDPQLFVEVVQVLQDQISPQASKSSMKLLIQLCPWGRNRIKAVEAGLIPVLIGLLLDGPLSERRVGEMNLMLLEMLCQCADGRAELLKHGAGLAVVSKRILRVSQMASERAVRVLWSVAKYSANAAVVQEMLQIGVVAKLCLVLQVDCGNKTKEKAREILKMHSRAWKNSLCIPLNLASSYPS